MDCLPAFPTPAYLGNLSSKVYDPLVFTDTTRKQIKVSDGFSIQFNFSQDVPYHSYGSSRSD